MISRNTNNKTCGKIPLRVNVKKNSQVSLIKNDNSNITFFCTFDNKNKSHFSIEIQLSLLLSFKLEFWVVHRSRGLTIDRNGNSNTRRIRFTKRNPIKVPPLYFQQSDKPSLIPIFVRSEKKRRYLFAENLFFSINGIKYKRGVRIISPLFS